MLIRQLLLDNNHFTTEYIPISYNKLLSKKQYEKSRTFYWSDGYNLNMLCRAYYINKHEIQIGDVWLAENLRGKQINDKKISTIFMNKLIAKIWQNYKDCNKITLLVHSDNKPAINLYNKLNFTIIQKNINNSELNIKNGLKMIRNKRTIK